MRRILFVMILFLFSAPAAWGGTHCGRLGELKREWIALEEKTSGGLFFSGTTEVNRLHTLRRIMEQPGAVTIGCGRERRKDNVDIRYEPLRPVR